MALHVAPPTPPLPLEDPLSVPGNHRLSRSADLLCRRGAGPHASSPILPSAPPLRASTWPDEENTRPPPETLCDLKIS